MSLLDAARVKAAENQQTTREAAVRQRDSLRRGTADGWARNLGVPVVFQGTETVTVLSPRHREFSGTYQIIEEKIIDVYLAAGEVRLAPVFWLGSSGHHRRLIQPCARGCGRQAVGGEVVRYKQTEEPGEETFIAALSRALATEPICGVCLSHERQSTCPTCHRAW